MSRSLEEMRVRATLLAQLPPELRDQCTELARKKSPSAIFNLAQRVAMLAGLGQMNSLAVAKASRWLAVIRRDYGEEAFEETVGTLADGGKP